MTIRMLQSWNGYYEQQIVSGLAGAEEARLIGLGFATSDLDGPPGDGRLAKFATDAAGNVAGLTAPSGRTLAYTPANLVVSPAAYGAGATLVNMATATLTAVTGSIAKATDQPFSTASGSSLKFGFAGNGLEVCDLTGTFPITAAHKWIGFWASRAGVANAVGYSPIPLSFYFTSNGFSSFSQVAVNIYPGLHYYVIPLPNVNAATPVFGAGFGIPGAATTIRIRATTGGQAGVAATWVNNDGATVNNYALNTEVIYIGDIETDPPLPKAKFLVGFDDCKMDLVSPGGAAVVDGTGATKVHSYASFVASYGFPVNAFIITGAVGNAALGYMGWGELAKARDEYGVVFGSHSHTHAQHTDVAGAVTNCGLRAMGQYGFGLVGAVEQTSVATGLTFTPTQGNAGILADLNTCADTLNRRGFSQATRYLATPQGGYDIYVNQAIEQMGYKLVRHILPQNSHPWAYNTFGPSIGFELLTPSVTGCSSIQTDGAKTQANIEAYVDYVIATGAIGSNYAHSWAGSAGCRQQTKWLCDYLAVKKAAGLIDVISMYEL